MTVDGMGGMDGMDGIGGMSGSGGMYGIGGMDAAGGPASACGLGDVAHARADSAAAGGMVIGIGGEYFDLGPGDDVDGDGAADSVTLADDRGLSIYSDTDGDGAVDHVTTVLFDGTYETWTATPEPAGGDSGGTRSGVSADGAGAPGGAAAWGVHEWERGERGRWA